MRGAGTAAWTWTTLAKPHGGKQSSKRHGTTTRILYLRSSSPACFTRDKDDLMTVATNSERRSRLIGNWTPLVAWAALITFSSGAPVLSVTDAIMTFEVLLIPDDYTFRLDEFRYHVGSFGVLAILLYRALQTGPRRSFGYPCLAVLALAIGFGLVDELHQAFVPGRMASLVDLGYDSLGAALFLLGLKASLLLYPRLSGGLRHSAR